MADPGQVELLRRGAKAWNQWRKEHRRAKIELSFVKLSFVNLRDANLSNANLSGANLSFVNLSGANLSFVNLSNANLRDTDFTDANLSNADLSNANLTEAYFRNASNLRGTNLRGADLTKAYLSNVNLRDADFIGADLSSFDLSGFNLNSVNLNSVNLTGANLTMVRALGTNFSKAILMGACIEDWHINSATNFEGVICDFIYLKKNKQERRPSNPNKNFAEGEFTKLFQKAISTVDLIFRNGINWEAFAHSFQQLQVKAGTKDLSIQAIENKGDGDFVIRVNTPPGADKAEIQRFVEREYQVKLKAIEDKYRFQLQAKEESIVQYRQENTNLWSMAKLMASRPINNIAMAESKDNSNTFNNDLQGAKIANFANQVNDNARQQANQYNYASPEKQTLAEAAAEIQRLLQQLEETNPSASETEQIAYVNLATKPDLKQRAIAAVKAGSDIAIDEFLLENKYLKVTKAIIQAWLQPE